MRAVHMDTCRPAHVSLTNDGGPMFKITDDQEKELRAKYPRVRIIRLPEVEFAIRAPTRAEYRRCRAEMHNPASAPDAQEDLVRQIVVSPTREEFDRVLDDLPALCENKEVSATIREFTGMELRASGK